MVSDKSARRRTSLIRLVASVVMQKHTAGSLVYVEEATGRVALVQPRRTPGFWSFPGGFHRRWPSERPSATAQREVRDELNLTILPQSLKDVKTYKQAERPHYDHLYCVKIPELTPVIRRRPWRFWVWIEIKEVRWADLSEPGIWRQLTHETRVALKIYDQHLKLGLKSDV